LAKILHDPRWTDVSFSVAGQTFAAHKSILAVTAPALLLEMKDPSLSDDDDAAIELTDINPATFENVISFCYTNQLTTTTGCSSYEEGKDLLRAADRFECVALKLFVESKIANFFLDETNAAECLLLAKSHSCAYLEEAATCMVTLKPDQVFATAEWLNVQQDGELMTRLLRAIIDPPPPIAELRKRLAKEGRDIDGSRETLVKRLQSSSDDEASDDESSDSS
jgi:speckle-type POZ protein